MNRPVVLLALAAAGAILPPLLAQEPLPAVQFHQPAATLIEQEGTLWGLGHDYKCAFARDGAEFIPVLGEAAPHNMPLRFRLDAIGRGGERAPVSDPTREASGLQVRYLRPEVEERWDVRDAGVEQSFVFTRLPTGTGDLVVDVALQTGLQVAARGDGLELTLPGVGGCTIGGVTGIDGKGHRSPGTLRHDAGRLQLSLPAAFVDRATLPLTIDPFVGNVFTINNAGTVNLPDIAWDADTNLFVAVWQLVVSATDADIFAQSINPSGTLFGPVIPVVVGLTNDRSPKLAGPRGRLICVFQRSADIYLTSFLSVGGTAAAPTPLATGTDDQADPDVGGFQPVATVFGNWVLVVWVNLTDNSIRGRPVSFNVSSGAASVGPEVVVMTMPAGLQPFRVRISQVSGTPRHLVVASARGQAAFDQVLARPIEARVGLVLATLDTVQNVHPVANAVQSGEVTGDGNRFVAAFVDRADESIRARYLSYYDATVGPRWGSVVTVRNDANVLSAPALAMGTESCLLAWNRNTTGVNDQAIEIMSIDPFQCTACEPVAQLTQVSPRQIGPALATRAFNGIDDAVLVFTGLPTTPPQTIAAQRWSNSDGQVVSLGGGCGGTERAHAACPRVGNASFRFRVEHQSGPTAATLVLSPSTWGLGLSCGTCRLIPDPLTGSIVNTVASNGVADLAIAIPAVPALAGLRVIAQWLLPASSPECALWQTTFSDALAITIQ